MDKRAKELQEYLDMFDAESFKFKNDEDEPYDDLDDSDMDAEIFTPAMIHHMKMINERKKNRPLD